MGHYARLAGLMFLLVTGTHMAGFLITSRFVAPGDFAQTARNIAASETLFRAGLGSYMFSAVMTVLLGGALYVLVKPVNRNVALFALLWRVAEAVLGCVAWSIRFGLVPNSTAERNLLGPQGAAALHKALGSFCNAVYDSSSICFALSSMLVFGLLFRARFIPRVLAALGVVGSLLVLVGAFAAFIFPRFPFSSVDAVAVIFPVQLVTGCWLLIRGATMNYWRSTATAASA